MSLHNADNLVPSLCRSDAYPHAVDGAIKLVETHISWVFLAGPFAYKVKKPVKTSFLDYSTLAIRRHHCNEELRLNQRFSRDLYLDVVPIASDCGSVRIGGKGEVVEYAVRMRRFPDDALAICRLMSGTMTSAEVRGLALRIAGYHASAAVADVSRRFGAPALVLDEALDNCRDLTAATFTSGKELLAQLESWTREYFASHRSCFQMRREHGHIRECHGDLHLGNVVEWGGELVPFDGIEFCEEFRWIDTLSDAAFAAMDFAAHDRLDYCHSFINTYFEATGDYEALTVLRWYLVYRAMVRAKVAAVRLAQVAKSSAEHTEVENRLQASLELSTHFAGEDTAQPILWITHGLSGSGKTTGSEHLVQRNGAVRIRADVERKRIAGMTLGGNGFGPNHSTVDLYSPEMTDRTYHRLLDLATGILQCGFSVVVDATFLKKWQRQLFRDTARRVHVPLRIVAFKADEATLRRRIADRIANHRDASDADGRVLDMQLANQERLDAEELALVDNTEMADEAALDVG